MAPTGVAVGPTRVPAQHNMLRTQREARGLGGEWKPRKSRSTTHRKRGVDDTDSFAEQRLEVGGSMDVAAEWFIGKPMTREATRQTAARSSDRVVLAPAILCRREGQG